MELVKRLLTEVVTNHSKVLRYPSPQVLFRGFGESSLDWEVWFFVPAPRDRFAITNDVLLEIDQAFREHGVHIPFPQRDLHLRSAEAVVMLSSAANAQPSLTSMPASEPVSSERTKSV
jgi:small-conductance mechanosensitive channel